MRPRSPRLPKHARMARPMPLPNPASTIEVGYLGHTNNLKQKQKIAATPTQQALVKQIQASHDRFLKKIDYAAIVNLDLTSTVDALNDYLTSAKLLEKQDRLFNWRSNFAGSIIPEFLYRGVAFLLAVKGIKPLFSTKESVVEFALSSEPGVSWDIRRKDQDLVVGLVHQSLNVRGVAETFIVPIVVCEVKTNTDINKLSGLGFSAERLKRTFPNAVYLLATETIDFSLKQDYASGLIDEIYVLRKQVRSEARRKLAPLAADVFGKFFADVAEIVERVGRPKGHVYERLASGKLIHGT
jgi:hypothetical protein